MPAAAGGLFDQLRREAAATAALRVDQARTEAQQALTEARAGAASRHDLAVAERARNDEMALARRRAEVGQRVRRETLEARAAALERVFAAAGMAAQRLPAHPGFPSVVARSITRALAFLPDGPVVVRCPPGVAGMARRTLADLGRVADEVRIEDEHPLGVRVESLDGSIAVDETFGHLLARARPRLAIALARRIQEDAR